MDGLTLDVEEPYGDMVEQNSLYDGYTCLFVWAPDGTIVYTIGNLPGSPWHDATLAAHLQHVLANEQLHPRPFAVAADTAFPCSKVSSYS